VKSDVVVVAEESARGGKEADEAWKERTRARDRYGSRGSEEGQLKIFSPAATMALRQLSTRIAKTQRMAFVRNASVVYTHTDEAPALATYALLPVLQKFGKSCGIDFVTSDISVAARILCHFGHGTDELAALGELSVKPDANIIKLPNVSASIPQLEEAIAELQAQGYDIPNYPAEPANDAERAIQATYANVLGSAVNPVLREGNSDRRAAAPVKAHAQQSRSALKPWPKESKTHIAHMSDGDFFSSEQSAVCTSVDDVKIEHVAADGTVTTLKESTSLVEGEVIDASTMSAGALRR
jgi:isocitrate dehydrogenase